MKIWQSKIDLFDSLNIKRWLIIWDGDSNKYKATKKSDISADYDD